MEQKLKNSEEWGKTVFEERNNEIALLRQSPQREQDRAARALYEMEEVR